MKRRVVTCFDIPCFLIALTCLWQPHALAGEEPITPIPSAITIDVRKAKLGYKLFFDTRLSHNNSVSCANCHRLDIGGDDDDAQQSTGVNNRKGNINAPTVFNSGLNFTQFWDGRARTLEEQIDGPVHNSTELASNWDEIINKLNQDSSLRKEFSSIYPEGISEYSVKQSIASFERILITPHSRFDEYLRGNPQAISQREYQGYLLFKSYGCISCHQGTAVGGNMYEKMGIIKNYFFDRGNITRVDYGRYNHTEMEEHRFEFKVPSLRLASMTAPYFHDGSTATLKQAIKKMSLYQLGRIMPEKDVELIEAFIISLTGDIHYYKSIIDED